MIISHATSDSPKVSFLARHHFLLRRLHSFTGIAFGGFLLFHLTVNATMVQGAGDGRSPGVFQSIVNLIHTVPFVQLVSIVLLILPIVFHTIYGIYITASGQPNVGSYGYTRNWLYIFQRVSAIVIMFFLLFHVLTMKGWIGGADGTLRAALKFEPLYALEAATRHLQAAWWIGWVIYPIGVLASTYHLANGFYTAGITWGLTISATSQKRWALVCTAIFVFSFMAGMTAIVAGLTFDPVPTTPVVTSR